MIDSKNKAFKSSFFCWVVNLNEIKQWEFHLSNHNVYKTFINITDVN